MLDFITDLAHQGGELALHLRKKMGRDLSGVSKKSTLRDVVSEADREVEDFVIEKIRERFPEHGIYAEENGRITSASPYCWVIDPIDGTASYIHNQPGYSISLALQYQGQSRYGAVYCPVLQELYAAEQGGGAYCNQEKIQVCDHGSLAESQVSTGFSCLRSGWKKRNNLPYFCEIAKEAREVRRFGSAALDLCFVAAGKLDAFWELNLQLYDVAAGTLIVSEAGGQVSDLQGRDRWPQQGLLASNKRLHPDMLNFFQDYHREED
ncbi:MAG: inositol monophosphatase family protein [Lentisphaeria bacterium]